MHRVAKLHAVGDVRIEETTGPGAPPEGWSTVEVTSVGLCGSDLHWYAEGGTGEVSIVDPVVPGHEFKFASKIQQAQGCGNPILLRTTGSTSHTYMPTDKEIQQDADVWAFEAYNLGIRKPPAANSK